ncbi:hypothetical protein CR513_28763, partial [Mucuna pruriens]
MDARTINGMRIVAGNARFIENGEINRSIIPQDMEIKEVRVQVPLTCASSNNVGVPLVVMQGNNEEQEHNNEPIVQEPQEIALRRSQRNRRLAISNDYIVYLHELEIDLSINVNDPISFSQATKRDSYGNLEHYKVRLIAKGFTQKDDIDYKETFSLVSRIIMALAHYDLELHQMDVKTTFLNGNLKENVYMDQPMGFLVEGKEHMPEEQYHGKVQRLGIVDSIAKPLKMYCDNFAIVFFTKNDQYSRGTVLNKDIMLDQLCASN